MKKSLLSFLLTASSCTLFAQWTQLSTEGGEVRDLITTPGGILVATNGGVFKSTNGGTNWTYSSNGLFAADTAISCNQFAATSTAFFVQTDNGIAKTTDNGANWTSAGNAGLPTNSGSFSSLVSVANKLYTCRNTNMNTYQIFTSVNDGANWTAGANVYSNSNSPRLFNVGGTVYVSKQDSMFTTATGASLAAMSYTGFPVTGDQISNLSGDGTYLYAGFNNGGGGFLRYNIAGSTWQTITSGMPAFIFSAGPHLVGSTLYGSILTTSMTLQTYTSTTQGTTWGPKTMSGMTKDFVQNIYSLGGSNVLLYNPIDEINTSSNSGATWTQHTTGFKAEVFRDSRNLVYSNGNLIASKDLGIVRSTNGGTTWLPANTGMPASLFFNYTLYNANNTLYSSFMDISAGYLYKSTDGAVTWTAATMPTGAYQIEFWGHSNTAVFTKDGNTIYRSVNSGTSWTDITANLNGSYNYNAPFVSDGTNLYVLGVNGSGYQVFKSTDDGAVWNTVSMTGIPSPNGYVADNLFMSGSTLMSLWADYSVMPATYKMCSFNGTNWTPVTTTGLPPNVVNSCTNCGNNKYSGGVWYVYSSVMYYMTNRGLFYSFDNGATFASYNNGFYPGVNVTRLASDGTKLYAGTEGNSIWSVTLTVGVSTNSKETGEVTVFPNPTNGNVIIRYNDEVSQANSKLVITDMLGATVKEVVLPVGQTQLLVETANLPSGVYFYSINNSVKNSQTQKLIISK
jgi:hypothetical protein